MYSLFRNVFVGFCSVLPILALPLFAKVELELPELAEDAPNVIVIFGDDMSPDYLGAYGGKRPTPTLDTLASRGVVFDQAYCVASMCTPSRYSLLTAKYPGRCRSEEFMAENPLDDIYSVGWNTELEESELSMGRLFTRLGYQTGVVGKWHLSGDPYKIDVPEIATDADVSDPEIQALLAERQALLEAHVQKVSGFEQARSILWANFDVAGMLEENLRVHNFEWILNGALDFLDSVERDRPFLMYFASTSVHGPNHVEALDGDPYLSPAGRIELPLDYYPTREQIKKDMIERANGSELTHIDVGMYMLDLQVAGILKKLEERDLDRNTILLYLSDHGTEPGKATSYVRGTKVPFFATRLGDAGVSKRQSGIVQVCDVLPTILDLATESEASASFDWDGESFADALGDGEFYGRDYAYFENGYTRSVLKGDLHYIALRYPNSILSRLQKGELAEVPDHIGTFDNGQASITMSLVPSYWDADQLYDLSSDPYEMNNRFGDSSYYEQGLVLRGILESVVDGFEHPFPMDVDPFQGSAEFESLKEPRLEKGTEYIYWYTPGQIKWPPSE
ncbi:sulfatase family protein [Pelagicoccus mobilis]|uniref:Sulfatase-like hydrolase/transferase n=1 Tax=Pelagicoccus mobilis TaxID=415221 RepID=A0A934RX63_9BACT|nr:sulfatase-like hydrolase/transferase [Pelagicoccus mobilis]MBK1876854.1 sulfatase-like hydrolase/transferase [Pelagicoccus mobilis]